MDRRTLRLWLSLGGLAVVTGLVVLTFLAPIQTVSIRIDLPPEANAKAATETFNSANDIVTRYIAPVFEAGMILALIAFNLFVGRRILRRYRRDGEGMAGDDIAGPLGE